MVFGLFGIFGSVAESFVDNVIKDKVYPEEGSLLYCDLAFGSAEHSGIYIGNGDIVHLDGNGQIELVNAESFMNRLGGFNSAISIYVSCRDGKSVGSKVVAERAKKMIGKKREYNLLLDNCHQFSSGCLTGRFDNPDNFLTFLKTTAGKTLNANEWRVWDR